MIFLLLHDFLLSRQKANDSCFLVIIAPSQHSKGIHLSLLPIDSPCQESLVQVARGPSMCWQPTWLGTPFVIRLSGSKGERGNEMQIHALGSGVKAF
jgi:hypothetical protein